MADEEHPAPAPEEKPHETAPPAEVHEPVKDEGDVAPPPQESSLERLVKSASMQVADEQAKEDKVEKYDKKMTEVVGDVIDVRRGSTVDATGAPKVARFLNSYKLEPDTPFNPEKVIKVLEAVMIEAFEEFTAFRIDEEGNLTTIKYVRPYDPVLCAKQAKWASETIRTKMKEFEFDRYKLISIVTLGEKQNQDIFCCCRFLWDFEKDNFCKYCYENPFVYGYALVFGLYYE